MLLYEPPLSSYAQKIKIALREKSVAFDLEVPQTFGTGRTDDPLAAANPRGEVPVLIDGDTRLFESTVILEYIEERWPNPPLPPPSPQARAAARLTEEVRDTQYEAVNWGLAARHTAVLQDWLTERPGEADWFGGASFGWADAAAAPMVNRSVHYGLGRRRTRRWRAGTSACGPGPRWPPPLPSSMRPRYGWPRRPSITPPADGGASIATTGWSG